MGLQYSLLIGALFAVAGGVSVLATPGTLASTPCPELTKLVRQAAPADGFPATQAVALTDVDKQLLRSHPIAQFAAAYAKKPVVFESMHFKEKMDPLYKGEWLQAQFLKSVLQELFPKARFVSDPPKGAATDAVFELHLADYGEIPPSRRQAPPSLGVKLPALGEPYLVPLHLAKPLGSRRGISLSRPEIRARLGIPAEQKVVSLYIRAPDTIIDTHSRLAYPPQEITKFVDALHSAYPFDTAILTFGNFDRSLSGSAAGSQFVFHAKPKLTSVRNVSEALADPQPLAAKTVLVNDTVGNMPYLHRAADLAVVIGPVNFFEPIQAGTKTLLIKKTDSLSRLSDYGYYDKKILDELATLGEKTGALVSADNYDGIAEAVRKLSERREGATLDDLSRSVLPRFLDSLQRHLEYAASVPRSAR